MGKMNALRNLSERKAWSVRLRESAFWEVPTNEMAKQVFTLLKSRAITVTKVAIAFDSFAKTSSPGVTKATANFSVLVEAPELPHGELKAVIPVTVFWNGHHCLVVNVVPNAGQFIYPVSATYSYTDDQSVVSAVLQTLKQSLSTLVL